MFTPIHDFLTAYSAKSPVRCHMPGGKSNPFDITEIEGADSLFESEGIIRSSEEAAARLFGAAKTLFSCGGSTLSIQTMLALAKAYSPRKNRVAASRYCHKSLLAACVLIGLDIDWIYPGEYLSCKVSPDSVKEKITDDTLCVFVQSIDYYGGESDIKGISSVCLEKNVPLLTDNAHGAYLVFTGRHPLALGALMTADSAHKTLPCLTGGGYLHISGAAPKLFSERGKEMMSLFGSSSPSYLILDSLDLCNLHIEREKERAHRVFEKTAELKSALSGLGYIIKESDLMRITIDANACGYSGSELAEEFRKNGVESEFSDFGHTVLLFSTAQPFEDFGKILKAAEKIRRLPPITAKAPIIVRAKSVMSPREAVFGQTEIIDAKKSVGRICADISTPCPPCVPLVMAGEEINGEAAEMLVRYGVRKIRTVKR